MTQSILKMNARLQIYRTVTKPRNHLDFKGTLYKELVPSQNLIFLEDRIVHNRKYYYLFRYLNRHNVPSPTSTIYSVELRDQEGYVDLNIEELDLNPPEKRKDLSLIHI